MLKEFRKSRKRRKKEKMDQLAKEIESGLAAGSQSAIGASYENTNTANADLAEGVEIEVYAATMGKTNSEVWSMLRRGELLGRTENGKLLVFAPSSAMEVMNDLSSINLTRPERPGATSKGSRDELDLPPLPASSMATGRNSESFDGPEIGRPQDHGYLAVTESKAIHPEIALLLDHLSLAKEENREIIKLTQDALTRVSNMTDTMIKMKDQLIGAKDEQLMSMKEILTLRDGEIRKLKQEREDLEMLARTLAEQN